MNTYQATPVLLRENRGGVAILRLNINGLKRVMLLETPRQERLAPNGHKSWHTAGMAIALVWTLDLSDIALPARLTPRSCRRPCG